MTATRDRIVSWINRGVDNKARWLVVACDTFDHSDYPIFFTSDQSNECLAKIEELNKNYNMQSLMEVYDLDRNHEEQMRMIRSMSIPKENPPF